MIEEHAATCSGLYEGEGGTCDPTRVTCEACGQKFGQENINDRLGWHHVMMSVAPWPLILLSLSDLWRRKPMLTRDLEDALYTKTAYSITEILASLPASAGVFLAFTVPAYLLTG